MKNKLKELHRLIVLIICHIIIIGIGVVVLRFLFGLPYNICNGMEYMNTFIFTTELIFSAMIFVFLCMLTCKLFVLIYECGKIINLISTEYFKKGKNK